MLPDTLIQLDRKIWPIIKALNEKGYMTYSCCEGHIGGNEKIYIMFSKSYKIKTATPEGVEYKKGLLIAKINGKSDEAKKRNKRNLLNKINEWVCNLENYTTEY